MGNIAGTAASSVTVVASHAVDKICTEAGVQEVPGGPALYIGRALDQLDQSYKLVTGAVAQVDVRRTPTGEEYLISRLPPIPLPPRLEGRAVILSPIMREIDPGHVPPADGLLAIDLQGFVREPGLRSSARGGPVELGDLAMRVQVVKGAEHEVAQLSPESRAALSSAILVQTHGANGAVILEDGRACYIPVDRVLTDNTIGAGDTFLAAFVVALLDSGNLETAGRAAASFTTEMLRARVADDAVVGERNQWRS